MQRSSMKVIHHADDTTGDVTNRDRAPYWLLQSHCFHGIFGDQHFRCERVQGLRAEVSTIDNIQTECFRKLVAASQCSKAYPQVFGFARPAYPGIPSACV